MATSPKFVGTFRTEVKKSHDVGWVPFQTNVFEYPSQEVMAKVKNDTYKVWVEKYGFTGADIDGGMVVATVSSGMRLIAEFETN